MMEAPANHKPMDPVYCKAYGREEERERSVEWRKQATVNKAFETLLSRAIASKGKDFEPYLVARRAATRSKAGLNGFYQADGGRGDCAERVRARAAGNWVAQRRPMGREGNQYLLWELGSFLQGTCKIRAYCKGAGELGSAVLQQDGIQGTYISGLSNSVQLINTLFLSILHGEVRSESDVTLQQSRP